MKSKITMWIICVITACGAGYYMALKKTKKKLQNAYGLADKHLALYIMMNQWVRQYNKGKRIAKYLQNEGYKNIAIYGMNYIGETLLDELSRDNINVCYAIDQNAEKIFTHIKVYKPDDVLDKVDAVIVTPITAFEAIENTLISKLDCPILSIEDILYSL